MDTIHQSGMGRGGSTLPPDEHSRISPTRGWVGVKFPEKQRYVMYMS